MKTIISMRVLPKLAVLAALLLIVACGSAEETPTPAPTPTSAPDAPAATPTSAPAAPGDPTPTPQPPSPGVTAVPTPTSVPVPVEQPKYGGALTMPTSGTWLFDPYAAICGHSWICWGSIGNLHNQLIRTSPADRTTLEGDLAESWTVSDDGITYTFKIREGIVDHEGNPFTAEDVWYQFVRVVDRPNEVPGNTQACLRAYIKPVRDDQGNLLPDAGAEVTGPNEVTVRLEAARAAFIPCLAGSFVPFLPDTYTRALDESGEEHRDLDPNKGELIGTGPFKVKSVAVENQAIWERSEQFFREGLPYLDELNIVHIDDAQAMRANFLAGRLDNMGPSSTTLTETDLANLDRQLPGQVRLNALKRLGWKGFMLNVANKPFGPDGDPVADKLRTAIQIGFDRQEYDKLITDSKGSLVTPYLTEWSYIGSLEDWYRDAPAFDPDPGVRADLEATANQLLEEAGYGPNNRLRFGWVCWDRRQTECEAIIGQMNRDLHVDIFLEIVDLSTRTSRSKSGDFQMLETATGSRFNDPDAFNFQMYNIWDDGGRNYTTWEDDEWLRLREQQALLNDNEARGKILREMGIIVYNDAALIGSVRGVGSHVNRLDLKGWVPRKTTFDTPTFESAWLDR